MESNNEKEIRARTDKDRIPLQSYSHVGSEVMTTSIIRSDDLSAEVVNYVSTFKRQSKLLKYSFIKPLLLGLLKRFQSENAPT